MTALRTTFSTIDSRPLTQVPYLNEHEVATLWDAIERGDLIALVSNDSGGIGAGEIVGATTPALADEITKRDTDTIKDLRSALEDALGELKSAREIVGEVFAEDDPREHDYRIIDALKDVTHELDKAKELAEEM